MQSYSNLSCGCLWSFLYNKVRCWVTDAGLKQEWEFVYLKPYLRSDVTSACSEPQINVGVALSVAYPFFWQDNGDQSTLVWFISAYFPFDSSQRMTSLCKKKKKKTDKQWNTVCSAKLVVLCLKTFYCDRNYNRLQAWKRTQNSGCSFSELLEITVCITKTWCAMISRHVLNNDKISGTVQLRNSFHCPEKLQWKQVEKVLTETHIFQLLSLYRVQLACQAAAVCTVRPAGEAL